MGETYDCPTDAWDEGVTDSGSLADPWCDNPYKEEG